MWINHHHHRHHMESNVKKNKKKKIQIFLIVKAQHQLDSVFFLIFCCNLFNIIL